MRTNLYTCEETRPGYFEPVRVQVVRMVTPPIRVKMETYDFLDGLRRIIEETARAMRAADDQADAMELLRKTVEHMGNRDTAKRACDLVNREIARARAAAQRATD